jgi:cytochrome c biogenesis protein CcmG/thiol:disulfide interchange protein DsbE
MKSILGALVALALLTATPALATYEIGDTVDDFTLLDLQGLPVSLSDFSGNVVLINFFATWCPPCNDEVPLLQAMYEDKSDRGLVILGIDQLEDPDTVAPWVQLNGLTYPIVLATDWTLFELFPQAGGFPYNAVIDQNGVLRYAQLGINIEGIEEVVEELLPTDPVATLPTSFDTLKSLYR